MKRLLLSCTMLTAALVLAVNTAFAYEGLRMAVGDCGGASTATFLCTTNTLSLTLVASVVIDGTAPVLTAVTGNEERVDVAFAGPVPAWWQFGTGKCRTAGSFSAAFGPAGSCNAYYLDSGSYSGNSAVYIGPINDPLYGFVDANRIRMNVVASIPDPTAAGYQPLTGDEVYLFSLVVNGARTVGAPSCAGCTENGCIMLKRSKLNQSVGLGDPVYDRPITGELATVGWQTTAANCDGVPARNKTWGQIKSLYR